MTGPRILVTGGGGQLGRAFRKLLPEETVLSRDQLDVTDRDQVITTIEALRPSVVINAAAFTKVDAAEARPALAEAINAGGPANLADACSQQGALLVQVSTDYVFDGQKTLAYTEDDETRPVSVYGKSKLGGEDAAGQASRHLIVRTSWVFGDGSNFVRTIINAADKAPVLRVVDDQRGLPTFAPDLADGILGLVKSGADGVYHLAGGGQPGTWADVADFALRCAGKKAAVERITTQEFFEGKPGPVAPRPPNSELDCTKAAARGVSLRSWREALTDYAHPGAQP